MSHPPPSLPLRLYPSHCSGCRLYRQRYTHACPHAQTLLQTQNVHHTPHPPPPLLEETCEPPTCPYPMASPPSPPCTSALPRAPPPSGYGAATAAVYGQRPVRRDAGRAYRVQDARRSGRGGGKGGASACRRDRPGAAGRLAVGRSDGKVVGDCRLQAAWPPVLRLPIIMQSTLQESRSTWTGSMAAASRPPPDAPPPSACGSLAAPEPACLRAGVAGAARRAARAGGCRRRRSAADAAR